MGFWIALQFLTIIPAPFKREPKEREIASSLVFFPVVGLLIGLFVFLVYWGLGELFPDAVTSALTLIFWVLVSGAMHLDGLADTCDGLAGSTPERRLAIMKDSHTGAFGVVGVGLLLVVKFVALASLYDNLALSVLLLAPLLGSWAMVLAIAIFPYARKEGVGKAFKQGSNNIRLMVATTITLAAAILLGGWRGAAAMAISGLLTLLAGAFFKSRLGGLTGDIYGTLKEVNEAAVLIVVPLLLSIVF